MNPTQIGPRGNARNCTEIVDTFKLFIPDEMLHEIIYYTTQKATLNYAGEGKVFKELTLIELKAFIGLLYIRGNYRATCETLGDLWSSE